MKRARMSFRIPLSRLSRRSRRLCLAAIAGGVGITTLTALPAFATYYTRVTRTASSLGANGTGNLLYEPLPPTSNYNWSNSGALTDQTPVGYCAEFWLDYTNLGTHHNPYLYRNCTGGTKGWGLQPAFVNGTIADMRVAACRVPNNVAPGQPTRRDSSNCVNPNGINLRSNVGYTVVNNTQHQSPNGVIVQTL